MTTAADPSSTAAITADPPAYRTRRSVLEKEIVWTLHSEALRRAETGRPTIDIPYRNFAELRLSYDPTRFDFNRFRCDLTAYGAPYLTIMSTSFKHVGAFEDRAATYAPFIRELIARVGKAAPNCRFRAGKRLVSYWIQHIFLLAMLLLLALVLATISGFSVSGMVAVKLAILAFYIPIMISYTRRNLPKSFVPDQIPPNVLPIPEPVPQSSPPA